MVAKKSADLIQSIEFARRGNGTQPARICCGAVPPVREPRTPAAGRSGIVSDPVEGNVWGVRRRRSRRHRRNRRIRRWLADFSFGAFCGRRFRRGSEVSEPVLVSGGARMSLPALNRRSLAASTPSPSIRFLRRRILPPIARVYPYSVVPGGVVGRERVEVGGGARSHCCRSLCGL